MKVFRQFLSCELFMTGLGATVLSLSFTVSAQEIYKSVDAHGRAVYSDRPSSNSARRVEVRTPRPNAKEAQENRERTLAIERANAARKEKAAAEQAERIRRTEAETQRKDNCRQARDRYLMFTERPRVYRKDAQGSRVYYSSEEIDAERAAAQQELAQFCDRASSSAPPKPK